MYDMHNVYQYGNLKEILLAGEARASRIYAKIAAELSKYSDTGFVQPGLSYLFSILRYDIALTSALRNRMLKQAIADFYNRNSQTNTDAVWRDYNKALAIQKASASSSQMKTSTTNPWKIQSTEHDWMMSTRPSSDYCPHCLCLDPRRYREGLPGHLGSETKWYSFQTSVETLMRLEEGCRFCAVLLESLMLHRVQWEGVPEQLLEISVIMWHARPQIDLKIKLEHQIKRINVLSLEIFTEIGQMTPFPWPFGSSLEVPVDPFSESTIDFMKSNISSCKRYHELCTCTGISAQLPSRILDVSAGVNNNEVRLIETGGQMERYATLSHCWGGKVSLRTTSWNLWWHKRGISWSSIPRTFQDAIHVTRAVGLKYLWIDSLCIVQDDKQDWEEESTKMASIYRGSEVTIVATRAPDSKAGFLGRRDATKKIITDCISHGEEEPIVLSVRKTPEHSENPGLPLEEDPNAQRCPITERGWCYQERLLGTRLLHFTPSEVIFECQTEFHCECTHFSVPLLQDKTDLANITAGRSIERHIPAEDEEICICRSPIALRKAREQLRLDASMLHGNRSAKLGIKFNTQYCIRDELDFWHLLVEKYSRRKLTYSSDLLPAISGIASLMATLREGEYLAGMWSHDLLRSLTWSSPDGANCARISGSDTPSWSWASRIGDVVWVKHNFLPDLWATCIKAEVRTKAGNVFGPVEGGSLQLFSRMIPVEVNLYGDSNAAVKLPDPSAPGYLPGTAHLYPDTKEDLDRIEDGEILQCLQLAATDDMKRDAGTRIVLRALNPSAVGTEYDYVIMALVLRGDVEMREFKRIGMVVDVDPSWFQHADKITATIF